MITETVKDQELERERRASFLNIPLSTQMLYRLGGVAVLVGGVLGALSEALHPADPEGPATLAEYARVAQPVHLLMFVGVILLLLGLPAVYVRQSHKAGILGLVGFVLLFFGLSLVALPHSVIDFDLLPTLVAQVPDQVMPIMMAEAEDPFVAFMGMIAFPTLLVGTVLLAISTIRARVFPSWPAWLLLGAVALNLIENLIFNVPGVEVGAVLFYLALAGFGLSLLTDKATKAAAFNQ
ncbi:MAG: hypothetical protein HYR94_07790 [Chloroflexi bacterium]|nr:hypothetical protein [Chloroflexota bacterium]